MAGYRGIFLDSIHPNIVKRLDSDSDAFARIANIKNSNPSDASHHDLSGLQYIQERTPWIRVVPFAIPKTLYASNGLILLT